MRTSSLAWILCAALLPLHAAALEYKNLGLLYTDAPFPPAETAGISLLTTLGAVEGNPDGTFRPNRTLNRAEFLKIALVSSPNVRVSLSDAENCFPDISADEWFSRYVCLAKKRGIVGGYPDGLFRPANPVNYAEALKILGELYDYEIAALPDAPWYEAYAQAATARRTALPMQLPYDRHLTRGQMARLAAAYRAEHEGELERYRATERGEYVFEEDLSSQSSSSSSVASVSSSGSAVSSIAASQPQAVPHLLQIGERSATIADGRFKPWNGDARIRIAEVRLERAVKSFRELYLLNAQGEQIAVLTLDIYDKSDKTWKAYLSEEDAYLLSGDEHTPLFLEAGLKDIAQGAVTGEYVRVNFFSLTAQSVSDEESITLIASSYNFPPHQTTRGRITSVWNAGDAEGMLAQGERRLVGSFALSGSTLSTAPLQVTGFTFTIEKSLGLSVDNWALGVPGNPDTISCAKADATHVDCSGVPGDVGALTDGQGIFNLFATVQIVEVDATQTLRILLDEPGTYGESGAVWWTEGTTRFTWIEAQEPLATGTLWTVSE
ncbi:MAG: S-layer homology domain-containing protein [Candidatus Peribacteraceae bacterium]|nr:S-layer homology domain-containing protein [Candidatus Peribacteraceae bacterium]